jgi:hypothetical protein
MPKKSVRKAAGAEWKKGRGKLGALDPLIGSWVAKADSSMGPVGCRRVFSRDLGKDYVVLHAEWDLPDERVYKELAVYGVDESGQVVFWSFTSDGKRSTGRLTDGSDVHPEAIAFEAQMPAGLARMIYWPGEDGAVHWAVESRTKKGWNRFSLHRYRRTGT